MDLIGIICSSLVAGGIFYLIGVSNGYNFAWSEMGSRYEDAISNADRIARKRRERAARKKQKEELENGEVLG